MNSNTASDLFDLDVSPDGKYLTGAITDLSGRQKLVRFEIEKLRKGERHLRCPSRLRVQHPG